MIQPVDPKTTAKNLNSDLPVTPNPHNVEKTNPSAFDETVNQVSGQPQTLNTNLKGSKVPEVHLQHAENKPKVNGNEQQGSVRPPTEVTQNLVLGKISGKNLNTLI
jgi:hypothetical protein